MRPTIADKIWSYVLPVRGSYKNPLRWSHEEDWWWGPFTYSTSSYQPWAIIYTSWGDGEDNDRPANVRISCPWFGTLIVRLPRWAVAGPTITRVYPDQAEWKAPDGEVFKRLGRDYYENIEHHEYGFSCGNAGTIGGGQFFQWRWGRSSNDSQFDKSWGRFLPWTTWRHIGIRYYGLQGEHIATVLDKDYPARSSLLGEGTKGRFDIQREVEETVPTMKFRFYDFDGEEIMATTRVEEREWRKGEGRFQWLSWFKAPIIKRYLDIQFSAETGKRKGSWKGGTLGSSIELDRGPDGQFWEGHLSGFLRYCNENHMTFLGFGDWPDDVKSECTPAPDPAMKADGKWKDAP